MSDTATAVRPDLRTKEGKEWLAQQAARTEVTVTPPPESESRDAAPAPQVENVNALPWGEFAARFFTSAMSHEGMNLIRQFDEGKSGLAGMCAKAYRAYRIALKNPPQAD